MFKTRLKGKTVLFDGAMGTEIQKLSLKDEDYPDGKNGFNDGLTLSRPDIIAKIHDSYLKAGADCIQTNTFGSNKPKLTEYGYGDQTEQINKDAVKLAKTVADKYDNKYVIGTIGPTGFLPSTDDPDSSLYCSLDDLHDAFQEQISGLLEGGVDGIVIETSNDILELKSIVTEIRKQSSTIPVIANVTFPLNNTMLLGTPIESAYTIIGGMQIDVFGINCSTGPEDMIEQIDWLQKNSKHDLLIVPNAGLPESKDDKAVYSMTSERFGDIMENIIRQNNKIKIVGGCCGTTPEHIAELRNILDGVWYSD